MKAIITGITGQDGSYLAEFLLSRGYEVHGTMRRSSSPHLERIEHILDRIHTHYLDLSDSQAVFNLVDEIRPSEFYNLAATVDNGDPWRSPDLLGRHNGLWVVNILEAIRRVSPSTRFFQASTSHIFGSPAHCPQSELTPGSPETPAAAAKYYAQIVTGNYRAHYGLTTSSGILYDHMSPRQSPDRLPRRITHSVARIKLGLQEKLNIDNPDLAFDWGFAGDYVRAFWMMLQHRTSADYVVATGRMHTVEDLCRTAFRAADLDWKEYTTITIPQNTSVPRYSLCGDTTRARHDLLWEPEISFEEMITEMVEADLARHSLASRMKTGIESNSQMTWTS